MFVRQTGRFRGIIHKYGETARRGDCAPSGRNRALCTRMGSLLLLIMVAVVGLGLVSCDAGTSETPSEPAGDSQTQAGVSEAELAEAEEEVFGNGLVTYAAGEVEDRIGEDAWQFTDIGLEFGMDHLFRTGGAASAELQFGESLVVHLSETTELEVEQLRGTNDANEAILDLVAGELRGRLDRSEGGEELRIRTGGAVVGVRGTTFEVAYDPERRTSTVGVSSGEVTVTPRGADEAARVIVQTVDSATREVLSELLEQVDEAYAVRADEQVSFSASDFEQINQDIDALLDDIPAADEETDDVEQEDGLERIRERSSEIMERLPDRALDIVPLSLRRRERLSIVDASSNLRAGLFNETGENAGDESGSGSDRESATTVSVVPQPSDAMIELTGRPSARGTARGLFRPGTTIEYRVTLDGYESHEDSAVVTEEDEQTIDVELTPEDADADGVGEDSETSVPAPAEDGDDTDAATDDDTDTDTAAAAEEDTEAATDAAAEEGDDTDTDAADGDDSRVHDSFVINFDRRPASATVSVNDEQVSGDSYTTPATIGETFEVVASAVGFAEEQTEVTVGEESSATVRLSLEPQPLLDTVSAFENEVVRALSVSGDTAFATDFSGAIAGVAGDGELLWRNDTENDFNENAVPVTLGDRRVHFSGTSRWYVFDQDSGEQVDVENLDADSVHPFGRRVAAWGENTVFPRNTSLSVYGPGRELVSEIALPSESRMTPLVHDDIVYMVAQNGIVFAVDLATEQVSEIVETTATQPIGQAPVWNEDRTGEVMVFADREGSVYAVDVQAGEVVWEHSIEEGGAVIDDIAATREALYVYQAGSVSAINPETGETDLFETISGVAGAPLVDEDALVYATTDGALVRVDRQTGAERVRFPVDGEPSTGVALVGGDRYVLGTEGGDVHIVHRGALQALE